MNAWKEKQMDDLISRRRAIELILSGKIDDSSNVECPEECNSMLDWAADEIKALPSASRWIPVTERLPGIENNIGKRVIVTTSWGLVKEAYYRKDHWEINDIDYKLTSIIAWMPLPEPWKGESDAEVH